MGHIARGREFPHLSDEMLDSAVKNNLVVLALKFVSKSEPSEESQTTCYVLSPTVPRVGESIESQDGVGCAVVSVEYLAFTKSGIPRLLPYVTATFDTSP